MQLQHFFSLVNTQAKMNLKIETSRFYLGYLWWVLEPLVLVAVYYIVFDVFFKSGREDFIVFLFCGKVPYMWFSKSVTSASNSLYLNRGLMNQINLPKTLFPFVAVHESLYKESTVFIVLFLILIGFGYMPTANWLWLIPVMLVQYGLILLFALLGAICVSFIGDVRIIINIGMLILLFASGIFWDVNAIASPRICELIMIYNPMAFMIDIYRQILMVGGPIKGVSHLLVMSGIIIIGVFVECVVLIRYGKEIAQRVLAS